MDNERSGASQVAPRASAQPAGAAAAYSLLRRATLYPRAYVWYVFFAALDVMLTWVILHLGGQELNELANWIIDRAGLPGLVGFKFVLVAFVVSVCENVGRRNESVGRKLAQWAVAITVIPVVVALVELLHAIHAPMVP